QRLGRVEAPAGHRAAGQGRDRVGVTEHLGDDLVVGPFGVLRTDKGDHAGDVRGGHRGAADRAVHRGKAVLLHRRRQGRGQRVQDVHAWGAEVHRGGAVIGEVGQLVVAVGGGDGDDVLQVVAGRVGGGEVVVR